MLSAENLSLIGMELIHSEIVYMPPKLESIEYMATTYSLPRVQGHGGTIVYKR